MRILMVNDYPLETGGGTETYISRLGASLERAGDVVEVFAGRGHHGPEKLLDIWDPWARRSLTRLAAVFRPEIVHHHGILRELSVSVLGCPPSVPCALTVHDRRFLGVPDYPARTPRDLAKIPKHRFDLAVARRRVDLAMAVSLEIADGLRRSGFGWVEHVQVFSEEPMTRGPRASEVHDIVFVGRLTHTKGADVLIDAFSEIAARYSDTHLIVVGDGPERERLVRQATACVPGRVEWLGWQSSEGVGSALERARVAVIPSRWPEGAPLVAIEAAMRGRPLVVSDVPGLADMVTASGGGIVVPAASPGVMAEALVRFLDDPALASRLGALALEYARRHHSTGAASARVRELYEEASRRVAVRRGP